MNVPVKYFAFIAVIIFVACASGGSERQSRRSAYLKNKDVSQLTEEEAAALRNGIALDRAERYVSLGQFSEGLKIVQSIINDSPNTVYSDEAYLIKGSIYENLLNFDRNLEKAAASYRMVIASEPESEFDGRAREALLRLKNRHDE